MGPNIYMIGGDKDISFVHFSFIDWSCRDPRAKMSFPIANHRFEQVHRYQQPVDYGEPVSHRSFSVNFWIIA